MVIGARNERQKKSQGRGGIGSFLRDTPKNLRLRKPLAKVLIEHLGGGVERFVIEARGTICSIGRSLSRQRAWDGGKGGIQREARDQQGSDESKEEFFHTKSAFRPSE